MRPSRMTPENWSLLELYASTVLMGGAPLFAKLVPVSADVLTLLRSLIGAIALGGFIRILGTGLALRRRKDYLIIALIGVVMALHWITYIHAIRVSTVAAALIGFFTFPILTALLEPLFFYGNGFTYKDILSGLGIFAGALILSLGADTGSNVGLGLMWGMISAILFVLRSLLLEKYIAGTNGAVAMFPQMIAIALILAPFSAWTQITASLSFIPLILVFAIVFTAI